MLSLSILYVHIIQTRGTKHIFHNEVHVRELNREREREKNTNDFHIHVLCVIYDDDYDDDGNGNGESAKIPAQINN